MKIIHESLECSVGGVANKTYNCIWMCDFLHIIVHEQCSLQYSNCATEKHDASSNNTNTAALRLTVQFIWTYQQCSDATSQTTHVSWQSPDIWRKTWMSACHYSSQLHLHDRDRDSCWTDISGVLVFGIAQDISE